MVTMADYGGGRFQKQQWLVRHFVAEFGCVFAIVAPDANDLGWYDGREECYFVECEICSVVLHCHALKVVVSGEGKDGGSKHGCVARAVQTRMCNTSKDHWNLRYGFGRNLRREADVAGVIDCDYVVIISLA